MKIITKFGILLFPVLFNLSSCVHNEMSEDLPPTESVRKNNKIYIPTSGNSYISGIWGSTVEVDEEKGIIKWTEPRTLIETFFMVSKPGKLKLSLKGSVPEEGQSVINVKVGLNENFDDTEQEKDITVSGSMPKEYYIGEFDIPKTGYVKVILQGKAKTAQVFADVTDIVASGSATEGENIFINNKELQSSARKGAKGILKYKVPEDKEIDFFYSEAIIPEEKDPNASFFTVTGFKDGYLAMKADSPGNDNRRIAFVINGSKSSQDIILNEKAENIVVEETGNGLGRRGYLQHDWITGEPYRFLVKCDPNGGSIDYSAWFIPPGKEKWVFLVSFKKTGDGEHYMKELYSAIDNQNPHSAVASRMVEYRDIQVRGKGEEDWYHIDSAEYDVDDVYTQKQRVDVDAQVLTNGFSLKNGGFFSPLTKPKKVFSIKKTD